MNDLDLDALNSAAAKDNQTISAVWEASRLPRRLARIRENCDALFTAADESQRATYADFRAAQTRNARSRVWPWARCTS